MTEDPKIGLGISKWWLEPNSHPFTPCAVIHDREYDLMYQGKSTKALSLVDGALLVCMLEVASEKKSLKLKATAYIFYFIAHCWGIFHWKSRG